MYSFDAETFKKLLDMMMKCQKFHPILMRDYNDMFYKDVIKHTISRKKDRPLFETPSESPVVVPEDEAGVIEDPGVLTIEFDDIDFRIVHNVIYITFYLNNETVKELAFFQ